MVIAAFQSQTPADQLRYCDDSITRPLLVFLSTLPLPALQTQSSWSDYLSRKTIDRRYDFVLEELVVFKSPSIQRALAAISKTC